MDVSEIDRTEIFSNRVLQHGVVVAQPLGEKQSDIQILLRFQGSEFVEAAYLTLLRRQPDPEGFSYYLGRLRSGARKLQLLGEIGSSSEARAVGAELPGLRKALLWQRFIKIPLVGRFVRNRFGLEGDSPIEMRVRALEQQALRQDSMLLQSLADLNHRQVTSDGTNENLAKSVPVALRKITRDIVDVKVLNENLSNSTDQRLTQIKSELQVKFESVCTTLQRAVENLTQRQATFEAQQLPTLLKSISEINNRQLASDSARDNLAKSVPISLRKLARDIVELRMQNESFSNLTDQRVSQIKRDLDFQFDSVFTTIEQVQKAFTSVDLRISQTHDRLVDSLATTERRFMAVEQQAGSTSLSIDKRMAVDRGEMTKLSDVIEERSAEWERRITAAEEQMASTLGGVERDALLFRDQIGNLSELSGRLNTVREEVDGILKNVEKRLTSSEGRLMLTSKDVDYLLGRIEFVRREVLYEMRYGAAVLNARDEVFNSNRVIVVPEKLAAARKTGIRLNLGCGHIALDGYLNVDRRALPGVDIVTEVDDLPFSDGEVQEIYSAHLIEHFPQEQLRRKLLKYWLDLLRPGGHFRAIAPDADSMVKAYESGAYSFQRLREVMFGGQDYEGDFHFNALTPGSFCELLSEAGFEHIEVIAQNRENGGCKEFEVVAQRRSQHEAKPAEPQ